MDYNKMKVNDLKVELARRNLDTKGVKAVLVERLKDAVEKESCVGQYDSTPIVAVTQKMDVGTPGQSTPIRRSRRRSMTRSPSPTKSEVSQLKTVSEEEEHVELSESLTSARKKRRTRSNTNSPSPTRATEPKRLEVLEEEVDADTEKVVDSVTPNKLIEKGLNQGSPKTSEIALTKQDSTCVVTNANSPEQMSLPLIQDNPPTRKLTEPKDVEATGSKSTFEELTDSTKELVGESTSTGQAVRKDEQQSSENQNEESFKSQKGNESSYTKKPTNKTSKIKTLQTAIEFVVEENEPAIDNSKVLLSWFDSDLNLEIDSNTFDEAMPISDGALSLLWAAARANLGATRGKMAFEVILTKANEFRKVTEEPVTSEFRVGWSVADSNLQLGEAKHSYAYTSIGSKGTCSTFTDYGTRYNVNDVVGVYLDLDSTPCKIEYSVNNVKQGIAFEFHKNELQGKALYPHVCSKNIAYKINFGQLERSLLNDRQGVDKHSEKPAETSATNKKSANTESTNQMDKPVQNTDSPVEIQKVNEENVKKEDERDTELFIDQEFTYIAHFPIENLVHGPRRPESRKECELVFLIGLPSSGKTHWVRNYIKENTQKSYNVVSVDALLDQMRLSGESRKPANTTNWVKLVEQLSKSLNKLTEIAAKRRKNFIFDQANVFLSEQKRKLRGFGEYGTRKAVIVIPDTEEHERRIKEKNEEFGEIVPENRLNVMKAHFHIPSKELNWFTEIAYPELDEKKAIERVKAINEAGQKALPRGFNKKEHQRRAMNANKGWNQGSRHYGGVKQYNQGGYSTNQQRYNSRQSYAQSKNYRVDGGYARQDFGGYTVGRYGSSSDWIHGRYDNRYNNRGTRSQHGGNYRGYNNGSGWNQSNSNCWSYGGNQRNETQQWYSWWQQPGGASDGNSMQPYWSQNTQSRNYGNYQGSYKNN